jgi:hypothetical protein
MTGLAGRRANVGVYFGNIESALHFHRNIREASQMSAAKVG